MTHIIQTQTKTLNKDHKTAVTTSIPIRRAPDDIMRELWAVKAQMNADAEYDVDRLLANVCEITKRAF